MCAAMLQPRRVHACVTVADIQCGCVCVWVDVSGVRLEVEYDPGGPRALLTRMDG